MKCCDTAAQSRAKLAKEVILRSRRRLCNNCTGGPTNLQSCRPQLRQPRSGGAPPAASAFTTISGYDGRMQAGRSPAAKKQRYITSNDRYKSRAFSLSSTCVPVPKIRHYQGNFALLYCSLTAFIPTAATGRQCDMARARRCSVGLRQQWQRWILAGRIFLNSLQVMTL